MAEEASFEQKMEAIRQTLEIVASMQLEAERRQEEADKRQQEADKRHEEFRKRHDEEMARLDARIRRAIRLAVQEARAERRKRQEGDAKLEEEMTKLAAAQRKTEEAILRYLGINGHPPQS